MHRVLLAGSLGCYTDCLAQVLAERFSLIRCHGQAEARALLEKARPEGLILLPGAPGMGGLSVLDGGGYRPPVILVLSGCVSAQACREAEARGVDCLIQLPHSPQAVCAQLAALLEQKG